MPSPTLNKMNNQLMSSVTTPIKPLPKVSVIVPVYNTELYVERAIVSLMEQTLDDVQFIIIDDGSRDNSLAIIKQVIARYPVRQQQVTLISRENRGVAATRTQGMDLATGDYVIHLDSDDWAELHWLEAMHNKAIEDNADVVVCEFHTVYAKKSIHVKQPIVRDGVDCVKKLLAGELHGATWNKLVRRSLIVDNKLKFMPEINYLEDFILVMQIFLAANMISYLAQPFINYNQTNESSITASASEQKIKDIVVATELIGDMLIQHQIAQSLSKQLNFFKLNLKYWMLYRAKNNVPKNLWLLYPEANCQIWQAPLSIHVKLILYVASLKLIFVARNIIRVVELLKNTMK